MISICASFFLNGPWSQIKKMFAPTRRIATVVYVSTLALTLFVALTPPVFGQGLILIVLVAVQFIAMLWYALSYIPFAREYASGICSGLCGMEAG